MFYFLIFVFGLSVGSFLNVVIFRLKTEESIISKRSHCFQCGAVLKWHDLVPLLSFALTLGKCRYCGGKISWQYPMVEISTGLIFLLIFNFQTLDFFNLLTVGYLLLLACFLIIIFVYDLKHYIIPDKIIYPAIGISFIYQLSNWLVVFF